MAMSPMVDTPSFSKTGSQVVPLFVVFHTPPEAAPTYTMFGLPSTTAKSSMRPPMTAGPSSRNSSALNLSIETSSLPGVGFTSAPDAGFALPFCFSFWPAAGPAARKNNPQKARVIRTNVFDMVPPRVSFH